MLSVKLGLLLGLWLLLVLPHQAQATRIQPTATISRRHDDRVLLELFVMSRCPDAQRVETAFDSLMERVHDIARVELHFVASIEDYAAGVVCKHGEEECAGNKQQLCVQKHAGSGDNNYDVFWQFLQCQDRSPERIGELTLAEDCLKDTVPNKLVEKARQCFTGYEGDGMMRGDVERVKGLGVTRSCTIFIEHKKRCVMDGGEWYDCEEGHEEQDFVDSICDAYLAKTGKWPALCGDKGKEATAAAMH